MRSLDDVLRVMVVKSHLRGHPVEYINDEWIFSDTKELTASNPRSICGNCGRERTKEGYDACLGYIRGAIYACCGHGNKKEAYTMFVEKK